MNSEPALQTAISAPWPRRDFALPDADEEFLDANYPGWETVTDQGLNWLILNQFVTEIAAVEDGLNFLVAKGRPEQRSTHRVLSVTRSRVAQQLVMHKQRRAQRASRITRGGLNEDILEYPRTHQLPIRNAVERNAASKTKIFHTGFFYRRARKFDHDFFGDKLDGCSEVHLALGDRTFRTACRPLKQ